MSTHNKEAAEREKFRRKIARFFGIRQERPDGHETMAGLWRMLRLIGAFAIGCAIFVLFLRVVVWVILWWIV